MILQDAIAKAVREDPSSQILDCGHVRILAIDDEPADLLALARYLKRIQRWTHELVTFSSPDEALADISLAEPDVVIVDYNLGAETGVEFTERLRREGHRTPVILVTGQGTEETAVEAMHVGVSDYLPKDMVGPASLARSITNAVQKHRLVRSMESYRANLERTVCELQARNEEIHSFYHTLSHELKTPLTSAREFVSIVLDGICGSINEEQQELLQSAKKNCDLLARYIDDLLDASRIETGKLSLSPDVTEVGELVRRTVHGWVRIAEEKGVTVRSQAGPGDLRANVDGPRIVQVLNNLLSNAIKFTGRGGRVSVAVGTNEDGESIEIRVRDTGQGIPSEHVGRVFERLYQATGTDHAPSQGLGLGLSICREIVRLHGGDVRVRSTPGRGTTFRVKLPRRGTVVTNAATGTANAAATTATAPSEKPTP